MRSLEELREIHYPILPDYMSIYVLGGAFILLALAITFFYFYTRKTVKKDALRELKAILETKNDNFCKIQSVLYVLKKYLSVKYPETKGFSENKVIVFLQEKHNQKISEKVSFFLQEGKFSLPPHKIEDEVLYEIYNFVFDWINGQKIN